MGNEPVRCSRHGVETRLRCAECGTPICPDCLAKTPVGLKCPEHAEVLAPPRRRRARGAVLAVAGAAAVVVGAVALVLALAGREGGDGATEVALAN